MDGSFIMVRLNLLWSIDPKIKVMPYLFIFLDEISLKIADCRGIIQNLLTLMWITTNINLDKKQLDWYISLQEVLYLDLKSMLECNWIGL